MRPDPRSLDPSRSLAWFRGALAGATLLMVGLSWPLWVDDGRFPRVPFLPGWPEPGPGLAWVRFGVLIGALGLVAVGRGGRWAGLVSLGCLGWSLLGDQNRLQPWVQQYLAVGLGLVCLRPARALDLARWYAVVLYAASGLSKLDFAFVNELGGTFLDTIGSLTGRAPRSWPTALRTSAILAMPLGEILIAITLVIPRARWVGLAGSVVQHLVTIAILGPWALDHSTIVLVWNGAMIVENLALFGGPATRWTPRAGAARAVGSLVVILVVGERWGLIDSWPAHALYASHAERARIDWPDARTAALPSTSQRWLGPPAVDGFRRLDLTGWSRAARGVPVYPQNRVAGGIAEALVARYATGNGPPVRVILLGRAGISRKTVRVRAECVNLPVLRRRGDRSWINAHPARWTGGGLGSG